MKYPFKKFHKKLSIKDFVRKPFSWLCRPPRLKSQVMKAKTKAIRKKSRKT